LSSRFFCRTGELSGADFLIEREATIGTDPQNQIVLHASTVSAKHARIFYDDNEKCYFLEDCNSSNGTLLDGMQVREKEKLGPLHIVTLAGSYDFIFQVLDSAAVSMAPAASVGAPPPLPPISPQGTMAEQDLPNVPFQLQPQKSSGTIADQSPPVMPVNLQPNQKMAPGTVMDQELPAMPGSVQKSGSNKPRTMLEDQMPDLPRLQPAGPVKPKTMMDSDMPAVPAAMKAGPAKAEIKPQPVMSPPPQSEHPETIQLQSPAAATIQLQRAPQKLALYVKMQQTNHELKEGESIVGRSPKCSIVIDHTTVSRTHASIKLQNGRVRLKDLGSSNRTFINGKELKTEEEITPADNIKFGSVEVRLVILPPANQSPPR
jgi:pSer/pThr/pTyr-binding forkhead associated (FHA) protein